MQDAAGSLSSPLDRAMGSATNGGMTMTRNLILIHADLDSGRLVAVAFECQEVPGGRLVRYRILRYRLPPPGLGVSHDAGGAAGELEPGAMGSLVRLSEERGIRYIPGEVRPVMAAAA